MKVLMMALMALLCTAPALRAEDFRLAVTTSFENAGLADVLLPRIKQDLDLDVQLLVVGTGQAIRLGQAGDVDAVLVHARAAEEAFVNQGYSTHRREIMYNDFVIVGPKTDPANVAASTSAAQGFTAIADAKATFVSRGDDSGTHKAERAIWDAAARDVATFGPWYNAVGAGMGAALNTAAGLDAYILADRASWLKFGNKSDLSLLFAGDPSLFNQYAYLPVNPQRHPHVHHQRAQQLEDWLTGDVAKELINAYQIDGTQLFTFNATR